MPSGLAVGIWGGGVQGAFNVPLSHSVTSSLTMMKAARIPPCRNPLQCLQRVGQSSSFARELTESFKNLNIRGDGSLDRCGNAWLALMGHRYPIMEVVLW